MPAKLIVPGVYALGRGPVNAYLIEDGAALSGANARKFNHTWEA